MVESSDKMWSTGEGNGKPLQYSWLENPINSMKRQKDRTLKDEFPRSVGAQYAVEISGETVSDFIFLGSKITAGGDCSHEIKRHLLQKK